MALSNTRVSVEVTGSQLKTVDIGAAEITFPLAAAISFANGTGAGQADLVYVKTRTISASSNEDLDLAGTLADQYGATITFARVKAIVVQAASGNTNNVNVTRPSSNGLATGFLAAGDGVAIRPGGVFCLACSDATGYPVTASTGDLLNVANSSSGSSVTYTVIIIGASA